MIVAVAAPGNIGMAPPDGFMSKPHNFSYLIPGKIAGSAHPGRGSELGKSLAALRQEGFGAILTLTEDPLDESMLREFGFESLHLPVRDFSAPTPEQIDKAVEFLDAQSRGDSRALVHCAVGYGRTGTILACYLVSKGESALDAIEKVRRLRPGSIEDFSQEMAICMHEDRTRGQEEGEESGRAGGDA